MSPIYGRRLLPCVLDDICKHTPSRVFATICENNVGLSLLDVTFGQIGNAVSYMAWWLLRKLPPKKPFETLAYVGISDLRYTILFLAAVKCRYTVCKPPKSNTEDSLIHFQDLLRIATAYKGNKSDATRSNKLSETLLRI